MTPTVENVPRQPLPKLSGTIPLDGAATVGELVARCAKSSGAPLGVDIRLGEKHVFLRHEPGQTVDTGELLAALALSFGAVVRSSDDSGEPWLWLVDEVETWANRVARLRASAEAFHARWIDALGPKQSPPGDLPAFYGDQEIPPALIARTRATPKSSGIALKELPPEMRADARRVMARNPSVSYSENDDPRVWTRKVRTDRVTLHLWATSEILFAGGTIARLPSLPADSFLHPESHRSPPRPTGTSTFPEATPQRRAAFRKRFGVDPLDLTLPNNLISFPRIFFDGIGDDDNLNRRLIDAWRTF